MNINLALIGFTILLNSANGQVTQLYQAWWLCGAGSTTIETVETSGSFQSNLTCTSTAILSFDIKLNLKPVGKPVQTTMLHVDKVWFVGNKGYFSYGRVTGGLCSGGAYVTVGIYDNTDLKQCRRSCGLSKQSTSVSLIMFFGGGCGVLNACEGVTVMGYSPPLTIDGDGGYLRKEQRI